MTAKVHTFSNFAPSKDNRPIQPGALRDHNAAMSMYRSLIGMGYEPGEAIFNHPGPPRPKSAAAPASEIRPPLFEIELPFVRPGDLVVHPTRPPLSDEAHWPRKRITRAYTDLEEVIVQAWGGYFECCSRTWVSLRGPLRERLPKPYADRREMRFREAQCAFYRELGGVTARWRRPRRNEEGRTAAFLLRREPLWPGGPGFIGAFAMDEAVTEVWAYRLASDLRPLLTEPGFVMAELTGAGVPDRFTDMRWAYDWDVEILLTEPPQAAAAMAS